MRYSFLKSKKTGQQVGICCSIDKVFDQNGKPLSDIIKELTDKVSSLEKSNASLVKVVSTANVSMMSEMKKLEGSNTLIQQKMQELASSDVTVKPAIDTGVTMAPVVGTVTAEKSDDVSTMLPTEELDTQVKVLPGGMDMQVVIKSGEDDDLDTGMLLDPSKTVTKGSGSTSRIPNAGLAVIPKTGTTTGKTVTDKKLTMDTVKPSEDLDTSFGVTPKSDVEFPDARDDVESTQKWTGSATLRPNDNIDQGMSVDPSKSFTGEVVTGSETKKDEGTTSSATWTGSASLNSHDNLDSGMYFDPNRSFKGEAVTPPVETKPEFNPEIDRGDLPLEEEKKDVDQGPNPDESHDDSSTPIPEEPDTHNTDEDTAEKDAPPVETDDHSDSSDNGTEDGRDSAVDGGNDSDSSTDHKEGGGISSQEDPVVPPTTTTEDGAEGPKDTGDTDESPEPAPSLQPDVKEEESHSEHGVDQGTSSDDSHVSESDQKNNSVDSGSSDAGDDGNTHTDVESSSPDTTTTVEEKEEIPPTDISDQDSKGDEDEGSHTEPAAPEVTESQEGHTTESETVVTPEETPTPTPETTGTDTQSQVQDEENAKTTTPDNTDVKSEVDETGTPAEDTKTTDTETAKDAGDVEKAGEESDNVNGQKSESVQEGKTVTDHQDTVTETEEDSHDNITDTTPETEDRGESDLQSGDGAVEETVTQDEVHQATEDADNGKVTEPEAELPSEQTKSHDVDGGEDHVDNTTSQMTGEEDTSDSHPEVNEVESPDPVTPHAEDEVVQNTDDASQHVEQEQEVKVPENPVSSDETPKGQDEEPVPQEDSPVTDGTSRDADVPTDEETEEEAPAEEEVADGTGNQVEAAQSNDPEPEVTEETTTTTEDNSTVDGTPVESGSEGHTTVIDSDGDASGVAGGLKMAEGSQTISAGGIGKVTTPVTPPSTGRVFATKKDE